MTSIHDHSMPETGHWKRRFLIIFSGQTISLIGSSAVQFALIWWLATETGSALVLSLAGLFAFLPQLILGPFAGVWIDRLKRKNVIIAADLFMALAAGLFALLFMFGQPPYWTAYAVLCLRAVGNVFHAPAMSAALPMLVPGEQLVRANGWGQFLQSGAFMLGPVLGAALYAALPMPVIMLTDVAGALIACAGVAMVRIPDPPKQAHEAPHIFREMKEGAAVLLRDRRLFIVTIAATLCMVFYLPLATLYPLMTSDYFAGTAWHAGVIEFVYAGGMMLCAVVVSALGEIRRKFRVIHLALIGFGLANLLCGLLPADMSAFWVFAVLCALMGAAGNLYSIPYTAYLQQTIAPEAQGRAFSLVSSLMCLAMPVGLLIAGPVSQQYGVVRWFLISGIAMIVIISVSGALTVRQKVSD